MSFAAPGAFFLAAVAVPIIVFYVLKVRLRRVPVSTNLFWKQIYDEKPPRSIWQYLRHLLSLLVQLALLSLLMLAVADPFFPWQLLQARRLVVVVDNSASMQAADVEPTRFDAAIDAALNVVEGLRFRDEMAVVLAGPRPQVVCGMSGHIPTLKRALRDLEVSHGPTELATAVKLGKQLIGEHPHGEVIVFTDGCVARKASAIIAGGEQSGTAGLASNAPGGSPAEPGSASQQAAGPDYKPVPVNYRIFGTKAANVGITQFQVRRSLIDPLGYEVLVHVRNAGDRPVKCRLELELAGAPVDVLPLELKPDELWTRSLEKTSLEGGDLLARLRSIGPAAPDGPKENGSVPKASKPEDLSPVNALSADDTAWAVLPARETQRVLIVTPGNLFLQKVFEANPLVQVEVRKDFPAQWPADTVVVLHQRVPPVLPSGNVFVVDPTQGCNLWQLGEVLENPIVTEQKSDSPLMKHVRLDNVLMPQARQLKYHQPTRVLAGSLSGDPIYAELKRPDGKCLVLSVNLDRGDLAFRTAFPIMVTNALSWFAGTSGELRESLSTGTITHIQLDEEQSSSTEGLMLRSPSGAESPLVRHIAAGTGPAGALGAAPAQPSAGVDPAEIRQSSVSVGPLNSCGLWTITTSPPADGNQGRTATGPEGAALSSLPTKLAVNLSSEAETDLRPPEELLTAHEKELLAAGWLARPLWFYLVAAACLLAVTEWYLYQRRVIT